MGVIVAPSGRPSMASTRACFDPGRLSREDGARALQDHDAAHEIAALSVAILMGLNAGLKARITDQMRRLLANSVKQPNNLPASSAITTEWRPSGVLEVTAVALMIVAVIFGLAINPFVSEPPWLWAPLVQLPAQPA
jgi:hypothetical protein